MVHRHPWYVNMLLVQITLCVIASSLTARSEVVPLDDKESTMTAPVSNYKVHGGQLKVPMSFPGLAEPGEEEERNYGSEGGEAAQNVNNSRNFKTKSSQTIYDREQQPQSSYQTKGSNVMKSEQMYDSKGNKKMNLKSLQESYGMTGFEANNSETTSNNSKPLAQFKLPKLVMDRGRMNSEKQFMNKREDKLKKLSPRSKMCTADWQCKLGTACIKGRCVDPCSLVNCPIGTECKVNHNVGECVKKIPSRDWCRINLECPLDQACIYGRCADPCKLPKVDCWWEGTECKVINHHPTCVKIQSELLIAYCSSDNDCVSDTSCMHGHCSDPCELSLCEKRGGACVVVDHKPVCLDASYNACFDDYDCPNHESCMRGHCLDPCVTNPCKIGTTCRVYDHTPYCDHGYVAKTSSRGKRCKSHTDCAKSETCLSGRCIDVCEEISCGGTCSVVNHKATCTCDCDNCTASDQDLVKTPGKQVLWQMHAYLQ